MTAPPNPAREFSQRGFAQHGEPINTDYGHRVRVYESSAASEPCIWLSVDGMGDVDPPSKREVADVFGTGRESFDDVSVAAHLSVDQARYIRDRLTDAIAWAKHREDVP